MNALDHTASEILDLAGQLVRIPTQGGLDPLEPAIDRLTEWFTSNRVVSQVLRAPDHRPIGVLARVKSGAPGPHLCLDAPIDTAPAGPPEAWRRPPFEGAVEGGDRLLRRLIGEEPAAAAKGERRDARSGGA